MSGSRASWREVSTGPIVRNFNRDSTLREFERSGLFRSPILEQTTREPEVVPIMNPDLNSMESPASRSRSMMAEPSARIISFAVMAILCWTLLAVQTTALFAAQDASEDPAASAEEAARKAAEGTTPRAEPGEEESKPADAEAAGDLGADAIKGIAPEFKIKDEWPLPDFDPVKTRSQIFTILSSGTFNSTDDERLFELFIKYQLARMTHESERDKLRYNKDTILKQLKNTQPPNVTSYEVHDKYLDILISELPKMFKNQIYVREAAAVILEHMNLRDASPLNPNSRATPYIPAVIEMLALVRDRKQLPAVKFPAVRGLIQAFNDPSVSPNTRHDIIRAFLDELRREERYPDPYLWRIISGLGDLGQVDDGENRPTVAQELMIIIVDQTQSFRIRALAAQNLSRIPLESSKGPLNLELVSIELVRLARDIGDAQALEPELPHWKDTMLRIYFAFNPGKAEKAKGEGILEQINERSSLAKYGPIAKEAYQQILPLVNKIVFDSEKVDFEKQIEGMGKWLEEHPQKSDRISPGEDPILTSVKP